MKACSFSINVRPRDAATTACATGREYMMGTSLSASTPPTMARSNSPSAMASAAAVMAWRLVAQARTTE